MAFSVLHSAVTARRSGLAGEERALLPAAGVRRNRRLRPAPAAADEPAAAAASGWPVDEQPRGYGLGEAPTPEDGLPTQGRSLVFPSRGTAVAERDTGGGADLAYLSVRRTRRRAFGMPAHAVPRS